jgi:phage FluMu protein Com
MGRDRKVQSINILCFTCGKFFKKRVGKFQNLDSTCPKCKKKRKEK